MPLLRSTLAVCTGLVHAIEAVQRRQLSLLIAQVLQLSGQDAAG
jgi:hypothetical protein